MNCYLSKQEELQNRASEFQLKGTRKSINKTSTRVITSAFIVVETPVSITAFHTSKKGTRTRNSLLEIGSVPGKACFWLLVKGKRHVTNILTKNWTKGF